MVGLGIRNLFHGIFWDVYTSAVNVTPFYILTLKIAAPELRCHFYSMDKTQ